MKSPFKYIFTKAELDLYESRIPPVEIWMGRQRLLGKSLGEIAEACGVAEPSVAQRLRKLHSRLEILRGLPEIVMNRLEQDIGPYINNTKDFRALVLFVRNFTMKDISRLVYRHDDYKQTQRKILDTIQILTLRDRPGRMKYIPGLNCKERFRPPYYAKAFQKLWDVRARLVRTPELHKYVIK